MFTLVGRIRFYIAGTFHNSVDVYFICTKDYLSCLFNVNTYDNRQNIESRDGNVTLLNRTMENIQKGDTKKTHIL